MEFARLTRYPAISEFVPAFLATGGHPADAVFYARAIERVTAMPEQPTGAPSAWESETLIRPEPLPIHLSGADSAELIGVYSKLPAVYLRTRPEHGWRVFTAGTVEFTAEQIVAWWGDFLAPYACLAQPAVEGQPSPERHLGRQIGKEVAKLPAPLRDVLIRCGDPTITNLAGMVERLTGSQRGGRPKAAATKELHRLAGWQAALQHHRAPRRARAARIAALMAWEPFPMPRTVQ